MIAWAAGPAATGPRLVSLTFRAWEATDLTGFRRVCDAFVAQGFVVASVSTNLEFEEIIKRIYSVVILLDTLKRTVVVLLSGRIHFEIQFCEMANNKTMQNMVQ